MTTALLSFGISWYDEKLVSLILVLGTFGSFFLMFETCVIRRVIIVANGFEYRTLFRVVRKSWDDILFIGVGYYPFRRDGAPLWIYFTDDCNTNEIYAISKAFLKIHYRKEIITEISKFYNKKIIDAHFAKDWDDERESNRMRNRIRNSLNKGQKSSWK
jgi:hypothetical protein